MNNVDAFLLGILVGIGHHPVVLRWPVVRTTMVTLRDLVTAAIEGLALGVCGSVVAICIVLFACVAGATC